MLALPNQTPGLWERYGLTRAQVDRDAWAIAPSGRKYAGAAAINRLLEELGGGWAWLGRLYRVPLLGWLEDRGYRWFAEHRGWFGRWGVTPECDEPGVECA